METIVSKETYRVVIWRPGVVLPNAPVFEFSKQEVSAGVFPAHALVVIQGEYEVVFEGSAVIYGNGDLSAPTDILTAHQVERLRKQ